MREDNDSEKEGHEMDPIDKVESTGVINIERTTGLTLNAKHICTLMSHCERDFVGLLDHDETHRL